MHKHLAHRLENNLRHTPSNTCVGKHCTGLHNGPDRPGALLHRMMTFREMTSPAYIPVTGSLKGIVDPLGFGTVQDEPRTPDEWVGRYL